ncbi:MAG: ABC transporter permease [Gemmatimonadota bacterium]
MRLIALLLCLFPTGLRAQRQSAVPIAVERNTAEALGLRVGDTLSVGVSADRVTTAAVVAAIYQPRADPATITRGEKRIRLHLPDLQQLLGAPDRVDRIAVALTPGQRPDRMAAAFNRIAFGYRAYPSAAIASESSQTFRVVSRFHQAIAVISVVASAIFLLCIMLLKVEERRLDAAMLRFVGVRRRTIFGALLLEACLVAIIGSILGLALAVVAGALTNLYYQHYFSTRLIFSLITPDIVRFSILLSLLLGVLAGSFAAWRLVRTPALELWRRG